MTWEVLSRLAIIGFGSLKLEYRPRSGGVPDLFFPSYSLKQYTKTLFQVPTSYGWSTRSEMPLGMSANHPLEEPKPYLNLFPVSPINSVSPGNYFRRQGLTGPRSESSSEEFEISRLFMLCAAVDGGIRNLLVATPSECRQNSDACRNFQAICIRNRAQQRS